MKQPGCFLVLVSIVVAYANAQRADRPLQPKVVTVEQTPSRKVVGSLSMPDGSPWCNGKPTYWLVGHDPFDSPMCKSLGGGWARNNATMFDYIDDLNAIHSERIDRHQCVHLYVNNDTLPDVACAVGANVGRGYGYNELYFTEPDGSLGSRYPNMDFKSTQRCGTVS